MPPPPAIVRDERSAIMLPRRPQHFQLALDGVNGSGSSGPDPGLIEQLRFMQEQESTHYRIREDYLSPPWSTASHSDRRTMCAWSYDIVDACSVGREAAVIGTGYFDRFMCSSSPRARAALASRREFQLAFVTCLVIALKGRAGMQVDCAFVSNTICQKLYGEEEIVRMETDVLGALRWRLNGPSPHDFVGGFLELLPSSSDLTLVKERLGSAARVRSEAAALDYEMALRAPSSIAYAALLTAAKDLSMAAFGPLDRLAWMRNVALATGMRVDDDALRPVPRGPPRGPSSPAKSTGGSVDEPIMCAAPVGVPYGGYLPRTSPEEGLYCGPASSSDLSVGSSAEEADGELLCLEVGGVGSDLSPVCATLDSRFDV